MLWVQGWRQLITALIALGAIRQSPPSAPMFLRGTIVSVRGGLLIVKPMLRPKLVRVAAVRKTEITGMEPIRATILKPGWSVGYVGQIDGAEFRMGFMAAAPRPMGVMKTLPFGGVVRSANPLIVHGRDGKDVRLNVGHGVQVMRLYTVDKNSLLIGSRIDVEGNYAPDGVLQADSIQPESEYAASGTMFGTVEKFDGERLTLIPRFTKDRVTVTLAKNVNLLIEHRINPDTIKVGQHVTVWGNFSGDPHPTPSRAGLLAIAITLGPGRYPKSSQSSGGAFVTGTIASLDPDVVIKTNKGTRVPIVVPAQLIISRLTHAKRSELRVGADAMFVLKPKTSGGFIASQVVLNASPWVGYGN